jgi:hypothetical protein
VAVGEVLVLLVVMDIHHLVHQLVEDSVVVEHL